MDRRPIKSRGTQWAARIAAGLAKHGIRPNWISLASVLFAAGAGLSLGSLRVVQDEWQQICLLIAATACIQMRLLCNLFDGMVAVEGGLGTPAGEVFNDLPDRLSDPLILIGAGYACGFYSWGPVLGWTAGLLAILTAYTRVLGAAVGAKHYFLGPMAKQHRMAAATGAALLSLVECAYGFQGRVLLAALALIVAGCVVTVMRRLHRIVRELNNAG